MNATVATKEMVDAGDDVKLIFDGGGTVWPGALAQDDHDAHQLWESVRGAVVSRRDGAGTERGYRPKHPGKGRR